MKSSLLTLPVPFYIKMIPKLGGIKKLFSSREKGDDDAMSRGQGQIPKMVGELGKANTSTGQLPGVDQHPFYLPCWSPTQQHSFLQTYQYYCPRTPDWYSQQLLLPYSTTRCPSLFIEFSATVQFIKCAEFVQNTPNHYNPQLKRTGAEFTINPSQKPSSLGSIQF